MTLTGTAPIRRVVGAADARLEDGEIDHVHVIVAVQNGILAVGIILRFGGAGITRLEMAEVLQIYVTIAIEVAADGH